MQSCGQLGCEGQRVGNWVLRVRRVGGTMRFRSGLPLQAPNARFRSWRQGRQSDRQVWRSDCSL